MLTEYTNNFAATYTLSLEKKPNQYSKQDIACSTENKFSATKLKAQL